MDASIPTAAASPCATAMAGRVRPTGCSTLPPPGRSPPSQLCAQSPGTRAALAEQLTATGYPTTADEYELGQYQVSLTGDLTSYRGYVLVCDWAASPEEARGWFLLPTIRDGEGYYRIDPDRPQDESNLGCPSTHRWSTSMRQSPSLTPSRPTCAHPLTAPT